MSFTTTVLAESSQGSETLFTTRWFDYVPIFIYFAFVLAIGFIMKKKASNATDFLTGGRSIPAWITGIAFVSANLGAVEIMGMSATGAQYGLPTFHYFWIGAVPAMIFLGIIMMPFYYGSKVRSVPEFMFKRYGTAAHLINSLSFALAQLLIAGINLFLLGKVLNWLLGWPLWLALIVAAIIVFVYISVGGLSAAIYNEVLQFFVIIAALLPLTIIGLYRVGGWNGLVTQVSEAASHSTVHPDLQLHSWPATLLSGFENPVWSVIGIVFGLGFVLSFGYWTTNFVEVQRAMASDSIAAAQKTPIIGAFVKMVVPFLVIVPGMVAGVIVTEVASAKMTGDKFEYNNAILLLMRDMLPNGLLGLAVAGLLASFMAGMAANVSAFNTVLTVDIYERYIKSNQSDKHYLMAGKVSTLGAVIVAIFTAIIASHYANLMDYLQQLFSMFNAPLFATFIIGMFWKKATPAAGWSGLVAGTAGALLVNVLIWLHVIALPGQGGAFIAASVAFICSVVVIVVVSQFTAQKPVEELRGLVYSETPLIERTDPHLDELPLLRRPIPLAIIAGIAVIALNVIFY